MKKLIAFHVTLLALLIMIFPHITYATGKHSTAGETNLNQHQTSNRSCLSEYRKVKKIYSDSLIDFSKKIIKLLNGALNTFLRFSVQILTT